MEIYDHEKKTALHGQKEGEHMLNLMRYVSGQ